VSCVNAGLPLRSASVLFTNRFENYVFSLNLYPLFHDTTGHVHQSIAAVPLPADRRYTPLLVLTLLGQFDLVNEAHCLGVEAALELVLA
jgi:hypothetical protein